MAAYIDEHESRFKVGPICRVLSESLDCGFLTPRGCRMFRTRPVSRMRAGHEALARDILQIHSDFFMAVYGCGKMHAQLVAQGWDPAEIGRDQVMNVMRESGIRGVRRGRTPVTTKPAKGTGGRPDLVERGFEAEAPNRLHVADITYVRMANGSFGYTAFVTDVYARKIVGWKVATEMTQKLVTDAIDHAIDTRKRSGAASLDSLIHHSDAGSQYTAVAFTERLAAEGILPSVGSVGDSFDNALAESVNSSYKTELIDHQPPYPGAAELSLATAEWVAFYNRQRPNG